MTSVDVVVKLPFNVDVIDMGVVCGYVAIQVSVVVKSSPHDEQLAAPHCGSRIGMLSSLVVVNGVNSVVVEGIVCW